MSRPSPLGGRSPGQQCLQASYRTLQEFLETNHIADQSLCHVRVNSSVPCTIVIIMYICYAYCYVMSCYVTLTCFTLYQCVLVKNNSVVYNLSVHLVTTLCLTYCASRKYQTKRRAWVFKVMSLLGYIKTATTTLGITTVKAE